MDGLYIPTLHSFAMDNLFTGSLGMFRFRIEPKIEKATQKEVDFEKSSLHACYWHGVFCYEKSQIEGEETFPLSEEGRQDLIQWLESNL